MRTFLNCTVIGGPACNWNASKPSARGTQWILNVTVQDGYAGKADTCSGVFCLTRASSFASDPFVAVEFGSECVGKLVCSRAQTQPMAAH